MSTKIAVEIDENACVVQVQINETKIDGVRKIVIERHNSFVEIFEDAAANPRVFLDAGVEVRLIPKKRLQ